MFNKGGNCNLQGGILNDIEKIILGKFNEGGICNIQVPETKNELKQIEKSSYEIGSSKRE